MGFSSFLLKKGSTNYFKWSFVGVLGVLNSSSKLFVSILNAFLNASLKQVDVNLL